MCEQHASTVRLMCEQQVTWVRSTCDLRATYVRPTSDQRANTAINFREWQPSAFRDRRRGW